MLGVWAGMIEDQTTCLFYCCKAQIMIITGSVPVHLFLQEQVDRNKGNGYRLGHTYGHGRNLEFKIPRDRFGNFHPKILAILKDQEEECERLAGSLYTKGLTQSQVGQVFDEIHGDTQIGTLPKETKRGLIIT